MQMSSSPEENMRGLWVISSDSTYNQQTDYHMSLPSYHLHKPPLLSATDQVPLPEAWNQSTKWQKIKAEVVPYSHKTFLPTSLHWYCQISPQAFLWFTDHLISSEQIDLVIKRVSEMQSSIKGHHYTQHSIKASITFNLCKASHTEERAWTQTWPQQLLFLPQSKLVPLDRNSWHETHRGRLSSKTLFGMQSVLGPQVTICCWLWLTLLHPS